MAYRPSRPSESLEPFAKSKAIDRGHTPLENGSYGLVPLGQGTESDRHDGDHQGLEGKGAILLACVFRAERDAGFREHVDVVVDQLPLTARENLRLQGIDEEVLDIANSLAPLNALEVEHAHAGPIRRRILEAVREVAIAMDQAVLQQAAQLEMMVEMKRVTEPALLVAVVAVLVGQEKMGAQMEMVMVVMVGPEHLVVLLVLPHFMLAVVVVLLIQMEPLLPQALGRQEAVMVERH